MDVVIFPESGGSDTRFGLFSERGFVRLTELFGWLAAQEVAFDAYLVVPPASASLLLPLTSVALAVAPFVPGVAHIVLDIAHVSEEALQTLVASGVRSVIVNAGRSREHDVTAAAALALSGMRRPGATTSFSIWLAAADDGHDLSRARRFERAGIPLEAIAPPLLPIGRDQRFDSSVSTKVPDELLCECMMCDLYASTLTIDADGNVRACPRHQQDGVVGNLMSHSPETIVVRKGAAMARLMSGDVCLFCCIRGRFLWPERKSVAMTGLFQLGMAKGADAFEAPPSMPPSGRPESR